MSKKDLWGDIEKTKLPRNPKEILKEQADIIGEKTKYVLKGRVVGGSRKGEEGRPTFTSALLIDAKRLDLRDFRPYLRSDLSRTFGSPRVNITGRLVCRQNMLDGTKLLVRSSTGELYPIHLAGPMDNPRLTAGATIANAINFPLQKFFRFVRKLTIVFD